MTLISFLPWELKETLLQTHTRSWGNTVGIYNVSPFSLGYLPPRFAWPLRPNHDLTPGQKLPSLQRRHSCPTLPSLLFLCFGASAWNVSSAHSTCLDLFQAEAAFKAQMSPSSGNFPLPSPVHSAECTLGLPLWEPIHSCWCVSLSPPLGNRLPEDRSLLCMSGPTHGVCVP